MVKDAIKSFLSRALFPAAQVVRVESLGTFLRRIALRSDGFDRSNWEPGQKLQVEVGGAMRTYTPLTWDKAAGTVDILLYDHGGDSPSVRFMRDVVVGARCHVKGPEHSLTFAPQGEPFVVLGDETSFALAASVSKANLGPTRAILEVGRVDESQHLLADLGVVNAVLVERHADDAHWSEMAAALASQVAAAPRVRGFLTGRAQTLVALRKRCRQSGTPLSDFKVRAYWSTGKTGMD